MRRPRTRLRKGIAPRPIGRGNVEGFTLVLMIAWLILLGTFGAMYYMDQVTKKKKGKQTE